MGDMSPPVFDPGWVASLHRYIVGAAVLYRDELGRVLLVKPTYRPGWQLPGGGTEPGEHPWQTAIREIHEEVALELTGPARLIAVHWTPAKDERPAGPDFVFAGGRIDSAAARDLIALPADELAAWDFVPDERWDELCSPMGARLLRACVAAADAGTTVYLDNGQPCGLSLAPDAIAFVTSNLRKFSTARAHLEPFAVDLELVSCDLIEIQSDSVHDVATHKARQAFSEVGRALIVEDSGFYIDGLSGFPGPVAKQVVSALGPDGVARLADLSETRHCHFEAVVVHIDGGGVAHAFASRGGQGTVAQHPATERQPGAWSPLWDIFIPAGATAPLSTLRDAERARVFSDWADRSAFALFGDWYTNQRMVPGDA